MQFVNLGRIGVKVSRICLGCMTYVTKKWREWVLDEPESRPFIKLAPDLGINFAAGQPVLWSMTEDALRPSRFESSRRSLA